LKKILLLSLILTSALFAEAKIYMGAGYASSNELTDFANSPDEKTYVSDVIRVKAGYGVREAYAVEFSMDYISGEKKKYAFDINLIKAFDWGIYVNPFVKIGFGAGMVDKIGTTSKTYTYGAFNLGTGIYIPIGENFDIELAYEYKNLSYQKENELDGTESNTANVNIGYIGFNVRF